MRLTYIFIDFENVQPTGEDVRLIQGENYRVRIFRGSHQNRLATEIAEALQPLGNQVEYVKCERKGKNALDFRIAFFLGGLAKEFESSRTKPAVVVISKDADLDTLLDHVRTLGFDARRAATIHAALSSDKAQTPVPGKVAKQKPGSDSLQTLIDYLRVHPANRPAKVDTLKNHVPNILGGPVGEQEKTALLDELVSKGFAVVTGKKIEYILPGGAK